MSQEQRKRMSRENKKLKIVIPDDYQGVAMKMACSQLLAGHDVTVYREPAPDLETLVQRLKDADVVVAIRERVAFSRELVSQLPNLRLIALVGRYSRAIDHVACEDHGVLIATGWNASPIAPAELTVALITASRRNVAVEAQRMQRGDLPEGLSHRLRGSTLGVYGFGPIGVLVAQAGAGLGMNVLVWARESSVRRAQEAGYRTAANKEELFETSDVLSLHLRMVPETQGIVTAEDLARMKPTSLLVNTARADLIEPGALMNALLQGRPGYAALDVLEEEPVRGGDHPYLKMPNVLCTPHLGWAETETFELYFGETYEQIRAFAEGQPLRLFDPHVASRVRP